MNIASLVEHAQRLLAPLPRQGQAVQVLLLQYYRDLIRRHAQLPAFDDVGFRVYSQFEEDGILLFLFAVLGTTNKRAVEICAGDGRQSNTTNLIANHGWQAFLFDGDPKLVTRGRRFFGRHPDTWHWPPIFTHAWITAENVNAIVRESGVEGEIDLLSLDLDGMDYWIWKALDVVQPRVVVCEINNLVDPHESVTVPYDPQFRVTLPNYCGASLAAMVKLAEAKGYRLVGAHRHGFNVFFVQQRIGESVLPAVSMEACAAHPSACAAVGTGWDTLKRQRWTEV